MQFLGWAIIERFKDYQWSRMNHLNDQFYNSYPSIYQCIALKSSPTLKHRKKVHIGLLKKCKR